MLGNIGSPTEPEVHMVRNAHEGQRSSENPSEEDPLAALRWQAVDPWSGIRMEAADDEEDEDADDEDEDEDDDDRDKKSSKNKGKRTDDDDDDDDDTEAERLRKRMRAADRRADKAERALKDKEREEASELENAQKDVKDLTEERDELLGVTRELSVRLAVLTASESKRFHDPEDVLRFVDFDDLADEDGEIDKKAVKKALADLAKKKPHLVAASDEDGDDEDEDEEDDTPPRSGRQMNGKKKGKKEGLDRAALERKFPALRR